MTEYRRTKAIGPIDLTPRRPHSRLLSVVGLAYLAATPLETVPVPVLSTPVRIIGPVFLGLWAIESVLGRRGRSSPPAALAVFSLLVAWNALAIGWAVDATIASRVTVTMAMLATSALAVADVFRNEAVRPAWAFALGSLVAGFPVFLVGADPLRADRASYLGIDENIMAFHLSIGFAASVFLISAAATATQRFLAVLVALTVFAETLFTGSRTGLGAVLAVGVVGALISTRSVRSAVFGLLGMAGGYVLFQVMRDAGLIAERVLGWLEAPEANDYRQAILDGYRSTADTWWLMGVGPGNDATYLEATTGEFINLHNGFWIVWVELGAVGLAIWAMLMLILFKYGARAPARHFLIVALPAIAAFMWTLGPNQSNVLWALAGLALAGYFAPKSRRHLDGSVTEREQTAAAVQESAR